jgi:acyl-CoA hydrolase
MTARAGQSPKRVPDAATLARMFVTGERVFMPGSAAEVPSLVDALCAGVGAPVAITGTFIPGINPTPIDRLPEGTTFESIFAYPLPAGTQAAGKLRHTPAPYGTYVGQLSRATFDTCLVHVSPPDAGGWCSFGAAVELTPTALKRSKRVFAVINRHMPSMPRATTFRLSDADVVAEIDAPLRPYDVGTPSAQSNAIADRIADFVADGATLQIGLGKVPDALLRRLTDRKGLRLHSGMLSDGAQALVEAGALDANYEHTSCVQVGSNAYLDWLNGNARFSVRGCEFTHAASVLCGLDNLVAVNGALSVDLFGQANLEMLDGRMISAVGGAADFSRAAAARADGVSIVALPAVSGRNAISRIVPRLDGPCSVPRHDIDVVITEFGVADLRELSVMERAERLIAIAAEQHRGFLEDAWREIAARL